jgi:hypothetical protein
METYRSLRAAKAAGYSEMHPYQYGGDQTEVKGRRLIRHPETALSATAWKKLGFAIKAGETPHHVRVVGWYNGASWGVYRADQVEPIKTGKAVSHA